MSAPVVILAVALALSLGALGALAGRQHQYAKRQPLRPPDPDAHRILFPFMACALSRRALDAALRLARAEDATLLPVFLARVPLHLPLDAALPRQSATALGLQEAIEHRAAAFGVPVDARIERGRSYRHALRQTMAHERFERIVIAAAAHGDPGLHPEDVAWLLQNAPGEIVVLRAAAVDRLPGLTAQPVRRRSGLVHRGRGRSRASAAG